MRRRSSGQKVDQKEKKRGKTSLMVQEVSVIFAVGTVSEEIPEVTPAGCDRAGRVT
jgi:hypothetical protein